MLAATIVMAVATAILVFFTAATWKILITQHKLYNDPELKIHPWPEAEIAATRDSLLTVALAATEQERRSKAQYVEYRFALVNRGSVPVMVTSIKEDALKSEGRDEHVGMRFAYFREPPRPQLMSGLPWLVPAQQFAICWRYLPFYDKYKPLKDQDFSIRVTFQYHNGRRQVTTTCEAQLRWGFDAPFPGDRPPIGGHHDALDSA